MPSVARTAADIILKGSEIVVFIEKTFGSGSYAAYSCVTAANLTNPGVATEKTACRGGVYKAASGEQELPTIAIESLVRILPTAQEATNVSDLKDIYQYVKTGEVRNVKICFGERTGDLVLTGPATFNQQTVNGPQTGNATGAVTIEFTQAPVESTIPA